MKLFDKVKLNKKEPTRVVYVEALSSKKKSKVIPFILQLALLYICLVGFLYSVTTSLQSEIPFIVVAAIALPLLVISGLFTINTKVYISFLSVFALSIASVFLLFHNLSNKIIEAFEFGYNRVIQIVVDEGYTNYASSMTEDITEKLSDYNLMNSYFYYILIVLAVLFSVIFTASMMKRSMVWLCTIPCFLVLTPSLYFGAVPGGMAFAIFISGIIGCYIESLSYSSLIKSVTKNKKIKSDKNKKAKKEKRGNMFLKSSAVGGLSNTIVVLLISLTVSVFVYSSDLLRLDDFRKVIDDIAMRIMNVLFYEQYETPEGAVGGLIENDTLNLDVPEFRDLPVMDVTTRTNTSLYLRGWIAKDIENDGWKVLNGNDTENYKSRVSEGFDSYTQFYNFMTLMSTNELSNAESEKDTKNLGFVYDTVNVKAHFNKSKMLFVPIAGIDGKIQGEYKGIEKIGDGINFFEQTRPKGNSYTVDSALQSFTSSNFYVAIKNKQSSYLKYAATIPENKQNASAAESFVINERRYSAYVRDTYMNIPDNSDYFESLAETVTEKYSHDFDKALSIERYFKSKYEYSLTAQPIGETALDKIEYTIKTGKSGYCTYYASAMTIMLRQLDIPARYVIGYHSKTQDEGEGKYQRKLLDKNYHAWVEAYFDGIGWLTFDPTPGYGNNAPIRDYEYLDKEAPSESTETAPQTPTPQQPVQGVPPKVHEVIENVPEAAEKFNYDALVIAGIVLLCILIIIAIAFVIGSINSRYNKMFLKLQKMNKTVMVRAIYPKILALLTGLHISLNPGEVVSEYALRADADLKLKLKLTDVIKDLEMSQFSENEIKYESAKDIYHYFKELSELAMKRFNVFKRIYFKIKLLKK